MMFSFNSTCDVDVLPTLRTVRTFQCIHWALVSWCYHQQQRWQKNSFEFIGRARAHFILKTDSSFATAILLHTSFSSCWGSTYQLWTGFYQFFGLMKHCFDRMYWKHWIWSLKKNQSFWNLFNRNENSLLFWTKGWTRTWMLWSLFWRFQLQKIIRIPFLLLKSISSKLLDISEIVTEQEVVENALRRCVCSRCVCHQTSQFIYGCSL